MFDQLVPMNYQKKKENINVETNTLCSKFSKFIWYNTINSSVLFIKN
jgi:hypothetical protein